MLNSCCLCLYHVSSCGTIHTSCHIIHAQTRHHSNTCIHSCIIVIETLERESVDLTKLIEHEPGVEFVVELEEN